jgi:hypothetical protein
MRVSRLSRWRLDNLSVNQEKLAHLKNIRSGESSPEKPREVRRQLINQLLAIPCFALPILFFLYDSAANLPVGRGENGIDSPASRQSCTFEQSDNSPVQGCRTRSQSLLPAFSLLPYFRMDGRWCYPAE